MSQTTPPAKQPSKHSREQTIRQRARRQARQASARRREAQAREERRLRGQVERVLTALGERDAYVARKEREAGDALLTMTRNEGLSLQDVVEWCGDQVGLREAARLRRLGEDATPPPDPGSPAATTP